MSAKATGVGTAMQVHRVFVRFDKLKCGPAPGRSKIDDRIVEVRRLLRTNKSCAEIANELGVDSQTLRRFVKRRRICDLQERDLFISRQKSQATLEKRLSVTSGPTSPSAPDVSAAVVVPSSSATATAASQFKLER